MRRRALGKIRRQLARRRVQPVRRVIAAIHPSASSRCRVPSTRIPSRKWDTGVSRLRSV
jgi:hypothetical protein